MPKLCVRQEDNWYPALLPILEISTRGLRYNEDVLQRVRHAVKVKFHHQQPDAVGKVWYPL